MQITGKASATPTTVGRKSLTAFGKGSPSVDSDFVEVVHVVERAEPNPALAEPRVLDFHMDLLHVVKVDLDAAIFGITSYLDLMPL